MQLLFSTSDSDRTLLLGDPSGRIAEVVVSALADCLEGAVARVVSSPETPPWGRRPPGWVCESWYRAVWLTMPAAERRRLTMVASAEAVRLQELDPTRCRTVVMLVDPFRSAGFRRPTDQWTATGDALAELSTVAKSPGGLAAVARVSESITLVAADDPTGLMAVLKEEIAVRPKREARIMSAFRDRWPSFRPSKQTPHWLDVELYARARGGGS